MAHSDSMTSLPMKICVDNLASVPLGMRAAADMSAEFQVVPMPWLDAKLPAAPLALSRLLSTASNISTSCSDQEVSSDQETKVPDDESGSSQSDESAAQGCYAARQQGSVGSALHGTGFCKPCAWLWTPQGCDHGAECHYCHDCPEGEIRRRKKEKIASMRMGKILPQESKSQSRNRVNISPAVFTQRPAPVPVPVLVPVPVVIGYCPQGEHYPGADRSGLNTKDQVSESKVKISPRELN
eukprot:gnl/TRDRNA2_/TRDRNA2_177776_c2_seq1.p1 gnl/TRDRNA2_/TRDRNA2_177776_c2~~gnl/TRDRNA2_/TRDRNA2_177776_c2_seq1.p1  ORF type:complete len:240 (-),score=25.80 gnl/TRDRNA2_/TRDRNA2_177776_c2_seq1:531-1250(-)